MSNLKYCIKESIINGLSWLSKNQNNDGSFGDIYKITSTALAIRAFKNYKDIACESRSSVRYKYDNQINLALAYLFDNAKKNSNGIYFEEDDNINMPTGAVLGAIIGLECPDYMIISDNPILNGYTFNQLINEIISYLIFNQNYDGGWVAVSSSYDCRYDCTTPYNRYDCTTSSSNDTSSYVIYGLCLASINGYYIPQSLYENLQNWVDYIQNNCGGGGDTSPCEDVNVSNTAVLIQQMYFLGYNAKNKNLNLAKQYITNNWFDPVGYFATGWSDCQNTDYKACYEIMVAFSLYCARSLKKSSYHKIIDWFKDITCTLLDKQKFNGSWPKSNILYDQSDSSITTIWSILTLENAMFYIDCY